MLTDADWNEMVDLLKGLLADALVDVVGNGSPRVGAVSIDKDDRTIIPGDLYVDGIHAKLPKLPGDTNIEISNQPDLPDYRKLPKKGIYIIYADVWERPVTCLEDGQLSDAGLHGADTCTRTQTMLQVKWRPELLLRGSLPNKGNGLLSLEVHTNLETSDPCDPCAGMGAADKGRVGNYLFRVEVHKVEGSAITLKWSSENGAEQFEAMVRDKMPPGFANDKYVYEFFDLTTEKHLGVHLATNFTPATGVLTVDYPTEQTFPKKFVRRWDGYCVLKKSRSKWSLIEGRDKGAELSETVSSSAHGHVSFKNDFIVNLEALKLTLVLQRTFVAGDYWLAPVREKIHRPGSSIVTRIEPQGIVHHYLRLARVKNGKVEQFQDDADRRRHKFPPLTDIHADDVGFTKPCDTSLYQGQPVSTVQEALALLCDIKAQQVSFTAKQECSLLNQQGINTVQDAIDALCMRPSGGTGCAVTVGPGGQYGTLEKAFAELQESSDICLCLLPGYHMIDADLEVTGKNSVKITGCGAGTVIQQESEHFLLNARQIEIRDLHLNMSQAQGNILLTGEEVTAERCDFVREPTGSWEKRYRRAWGKQAIVDENGDVIMIGFFSDTVNFGGEDLQSAGQDDIFITKLNGKNGELIWARRFGGKGMDRGESVIVDSKGDLFITGLFSGTVDFGGSELVGGDGWGNIFLVKLKGTDGSHVWSKSFGGTGTNFIKDSAVDSNGNIIMTGEFQGKINFGGDSLESVGNKSDIFVVKLKADGSHNWSKSFGGNGMDKGESITVDSGDNVLVTGSFGATINFGGGSLKSKGNSDIFVAKLSGNQGEYIWAKGFGSEGEDSGNGIAVDNQGAVLITGSFRDTINFGGGSLESKGNSDIFVAKLSGDNGEYIWAKGFGSAGTDAGNSITTDSHNNVIITGIFSDSVDFGGTGHTSQHKETETEPDIFILTLNMDGHYICSQGLGYIGHDLWPDVAVGKSDEIVILWTNDEHVEQQGVMLTVRKQSKTPPLVRVNTIEKVNSTAMHWVGNRMVSSQEALALEAGVGGWIADNDVSGDLVLNYTENAVPLLWSKTTELQQENKQDWAKDDSWAEDDSNEYIPWNRINLTLHLRGNTISQVRSNGTSIMAVMDDILDHGKSKPVSQEGYHSIIATENVFRSNGNSFICRYLVMNSNQLLAWPRREFDVAAFVLGYDGVFSGNTGPITYQEKEREVVIETILKRKAVAANLLEIR